MPAQLLRSPHGLCVCITHRAAPHSLVPCYPQTAQTPNAPTNRLSPLARLTPPQTRAPGSTCPFPQAPTAQNTGSLPLPSNHSCIVFSSFDRPCSPSASTCTLNVETSSIVIQTHITRLPEYFTSRVLRVSDCPPKRSDPRRRRRRSLFRIAHARGANPNEVGPTRCRATGGGVSLTRLGYRGKINSLSDRPRTKCASERGGGVYGRSLSGISNARSDS